MTSRTTPPNQPDALDEYARLMGEVELPATVKAAVMGETENASTRATDDLPPDRLRSANVRVMRRPFGRWVGIAACFVLAAGIGMFALIAGPAVVNHPDGSETAEGGTPLVASDNLPVGNFFTLTAYADEGNQPAAAGTTVSLDANGIRPVSYTNEWVDPETGEAADGREYAGMNAGMNASVSGNNVETITYSIEGEGAYLETISDDPPTQEEIDAFENGSTDSLSYSELQRAKSFTLDYSEVALEDGTQLSDVPTILSIYLKVPVPETVLADWDAMDDADDFDTYRDAEIDFYKNIDVAGSQVLSTCRLTLTATFTDGTTQTKTYAIGVVDDYEQRIAAYWDAVDESGRAYDRAMVNGEEPSEEAYEKANNRPEEPALYTLTEVAENE